MDDDVRLTLRVPRGENDRWKLVAAAKGMSVSGYVLDATRRAFREDAGSPEARQRLLAALEGGEADGAG